MTAAGQTVFDADFRALLSKAFDDRVVEWTAEAEAQQRFPRKLIEHLGACGVFTAKWSDHTQPDVNKLVELALALGHLTSAGIGVGVSLHDSAIALLRRFGKSDYLRTFASRRFAARRCSASVRRRNLADRIFRSSKPKSALGTAVSMFAVSRNSCHFLRSPTTSWWWRAASTTTRPAGMETSR